MSKLLPSLETFRVSQRIIKAGTGTAQAPGWLPVSCHLRTHPMGLAGISKPGRGGRRLMESNHWEQGVIKVPVFH